jgi:cytochrome c peroxidase
MVNQTQSVLSLVFLLWLPTTFAFSPVEEIPPPQVLAPGWSALEYEPPTAGTYALPPLGNAPDGDVLDHQNHPYRLHQLLADKIVLLSFVYNSCNDVNGCPLATRVMHQVKTAMQEDPALAENLRLISLSFDPARDTPDAIRHHSTQFRQGTGDWRFLTTESQAKLDPILQGYNQVVQPEINPQGEALGTFSHLLRVFLIDKQKRLRNIYSAAFLHADVVLTDVRTLLLEQPIATEVINASAANGSRLSGAGDYKGGYEHSNYQTRSLSLTGRQGAVADLLKLANGPPLGLPPLPVPADNPLTSKKIALGRKLFFDRRLSLNDTFSCAMCHVPEQGFAHNELATAVGIEGRTVRRNTPSLFNAGYAKRLFHDGRENKLEQQIWQPLMAHNEMGNPSVAAVIDKIKYMPDYANLFEDAFQGKGPTMETVGMAIASYERALVSAHSPFDRWYFAGEENALNESAKRGHALFTGKANCVACHRIEDDHALFNDHKLHNTGIGYRRSMAKEPHTHRVVVAPGVFLEVERATYAAAAENPPNDLGLYEITQNPYDRWKYKTPSLRNTALTAPYMHDGSLASLPEVVDFYDQGGVPNELLSPLIRPLELSDDEKDDLVAFLESLTGENVDVLVSDAFAAPVGDLKRDDPNWSHTNQIQYE